MAFFDKVKGFLKKAKEKSKCFALATARYNNEKAYYGYVNYKIGKLDPTDDFMGGSNLNVENGKGLIYHTSTSGVNDYYFEKGDIVSFELIGDGHTNTRSGPNNTKIEHLTLRFAVEFKDGKKTTMDILVKKLDTFKAIFGL